MTIIEARMIAFGVLIISSGACVTTNMTSPAPTAGPTQTAKPPDGDLGLYRICVDATGSVTTVHGVEPLRTASLDATVRGRVLSWKYKPLLKDGVPVPFCYKARFDLKPDGKVPGSDGLAAQPGVEAARPLARGLTP